MFFRGESNVPGAPGNLSGFNNLIAQGMPMPPQGGFPAQAGIQPMQRFQGYPPMGMPETMDPYGPKPFNLDIEGEDDKLKSIGANATIQLDPNQRLRFAGSYTPASVDEMGVPTSQGYAIRGSYETPGMGINVNWKGGNRRQMGGGGGFPGMFGAGIQGRW